MELQLGKFGGLVGRQPQVFVFVGPAGAGKNRIWGNLVDAVSGLGVPVSTTTREPRNRRVQEQDGVHYHFVTVEEFEVRVNAGKFLEHALVHGNRYGLERDSLERIFAEGKDAICDLSLEGAINLKRAFPNRVVVIFVLPSRFAVLRDRMIGRGTDDPEELNTRLKTATGEIQQVVWGQIADYLIVNDEIHLSIETARGIIAAERNRFALQQFDPRRYLEDQTAH